jgi:hypothetical protein
MYPPSTTPLAAAGSPEVVGLFRDGPCLFSVHVDGMDPSPMLVACLLLRTSFLALGLQFFFGRHALHYSQTNFILSKIADVKPAILKKKMGGTNYPRGRIILGDELS